MEGLYINQDIKDVEKIKEIKYFANEYTKYLNSLPNELFIKHHKGNYLDMYNDKNSMIDQSDEYISLTESFKNNSTVYSAKSIIDYISSTYDLPKDFFIVSVLNHIEIIHYKMLPSFFKCPVAMSVPAVEGNLNIITYEMIKYGYDFIAVKTRKEKDYTWLEVIFKPIYQESIRKMLNDDKTILYHLSPDFNDYDIEKNGLIPQDGTRIYKFKHRLYLALNAGKSNENFNIMMHSISEQIKRKNKNWSGYFTRYSIDVNDLPDYIDFYYDPYNSVYTKQKIEFEYISKIKHNLTF